MHGKAIATTPCPGRSLRWRRQQKDLLERNRQAIEEIAREQSPQRVEEKAGTAVGPLDPANITRVPVGSLGEGR